MHVNDQGSPTKDLDASTAHAPLVTKPLNVVDFQDGQQNEPDSNTKQIVTDNGQDDDYDFLESSSLSDWSSEEEKAQRDKLKNLQADGRLPDKYRLPKDTHSMLEQMADELEEKD